jgi:hypothetical protein
MAETRKIARNLVADVVGYSRLAGADARSDSTQRRKAGVPEGWRPVDSPQS